MFGKIKLSAEQVEQVISECKPVMVRYAVEGDIFGMCNATTNKYNIRRKNRFESTYSQCWGVKLQSHYVARPTMQVLFVFGDNNTIEVYDISKKQLNSIGSIIDAVDAFMEKAFSDEAYSEMQERKLSKRWFWKKIDYLNKIWSGKLSRLSYFKSNDPFSEAEYVYDHEFFTYSGRVLVNGKWVRQTFNGEEAITYLEGSGYVLESCEALKAA